MNKRGAGQNRRHITEQGHSRKGQRTKQTNSRTEDRHSRTEEEHPRTEETQWNMREGQLGRIVAPGQYFSRLYRHKSTASGQD
jgi:hypothetical protein